MLFSSQRVEVLDELFADLFAHGVADVVGALADVCWIGQSLQQGFLPGVVILIQADFYQVFLANFINWSISDKRVYRKLSAQSFHLSINYPSIF